MSWLSDIAGAVLSAGTGGIFGVLSSLVSVGAKYLQEKQRQAWEQKQWDHEARMIELQMKMSSQEAKQQLDIVQQRGSWQGLTRSLESDAAIANRAPAWVNAIRSLYRPFLTTALFGLVLWIWIDLMSALHGGPSDNLLAIFTEGEVKELLQYITRAVVFTATAAAAWWFGERAMTLTGNKNR